jgi:hypothetical protein
MPQPPTNKEREKVKRTILIESYKGEFTRSVTLEYERGSEFIDVSADAGGNGATVTVRLADLRKAIEGITHDQT